MRQGTLCICGVEARDAKVRGHAGLAHIAFVRVLWRLAVFGGSFGALLLSFGGAAGLRWPFSFVGPSLRAGRSIPTRGRGPGQRQRCFLSKTLGDVGVGSGRRNRAGERSRV